MDLLDYSAVFELNNINNISLLRRLSKEIMAKWYVIFH